MKVFWLIILFLCAKYSHSKPEEWIYMEHNSDTNQITFMDGKYETNTTKKEYFEMFKQLKKDEHIINEYRGFSTINIFMHPHLKNKAVVGGGGEGIWAIKKGGVWKVIPRAYLFPYTEDEEPNSIKREEKNRIRDLAFAKNGISKQWRPDMSEGVIFEYNDTIYTPKYITKTVKVNVSKWGYKNRPDEIVEILNDKNTLETRAVGDILYYKQNIVVEKQIIVEE